MSKILPSILISLMLLAPRVGIAANEQEYRLLLMQLISALQEQIALLQAELEGETTVESVTREIVVREKKQFVPPPERGYIVQGYYMNPLGGRDINPLHEEAWEIFVELVGESFANEHVGEFHGYNDEDGDFDAYMILESDEQLWSLKVNFYELDLSLKNHRTSFEQLMIHEFGHILVHNKPDLITQFTDEFWDVSDLNRGYDRYNKRYYVSEYAATDPLEDVVESFTHFVLDDRPDGALLFEEKIDFFYEYPQFLRERNRVRDIL